MSKIARDAAKEIGAVSPHERKPFDEIIDHHLAPTLALMERLGGKAFMLHDVLTIYKGHRLREYPEQCDLCAISTDYKAWKKEHG